MKDYRCARCRALLFKGTAATIGDVLEIKCRRCAAINVLRPAEPEPKRPASATVASELGETTTPLSARRRSHPA